MAWKTAQQTEIPADQIYKAYESSAFVDKPLMAIGPAGWHHLVLSRVGEGREDMWHAHSNDPTDPSYPLWDTTRVEPLANWAYDDWQGLGASPVVLSNGRAVVVAHDYRTRYNDGLPYVVYCDVPLPGVGWDWKPDSADGDSIIKVAGGAGIQPAQDPDTPHYIDRNHCFPAIAVDHTNDDVYVAFYARAAPGDPRNDLNADIYISRSTDGGQSFPNVPEQLVHLTDLQIGAPDRAPRGPDQVMPSIAIDGCGGVNLVFYDNRNDPNYTDEHDYLDVFFVRITNFGTVNQDVYWERLTPQKFELVGSDFLGDYHHMAVAGLNEKTLYPAYIAPTAQYPDQRNCYVHQIRIFCLADLNLDGASDGLDVALFEAVYGARDRGADLNRDGVVDEQDETLFWDAYRNGCDGR